MKKNTAIILSIIFLALAIIGIVGALSSRSGHESVKSADEESVAKGIGTSLPKQSDNGNTADQALPHSGDGEAMLRVRIPDSVPSQIKEYTGFVVSFNAGNRTPNWVGWELLGRETEGKLPRHKKFWQDSDVKGCPEPADYTNSGYDRGHMCPAADQKWSAEAMVDCFSLANIVPQDNSLNTGAWSTLENKERLWAKRDSALLIVCGPIYAESDRKRIGKNGVRVPGAFFKVLAAPFAREPRGIAFVYPNMSSPGNMQNYVMTIRELEKLTGYDFFHTLPAEFQDRLETTASFRDWN